MNQYDNNTLQKIAQSFVFTKQRNYSPEDQSVFSRIESYRQNLLRDQTSISLELFGIDKKLTVSEICQKASSPNIWGQFFYFLTKELSSKNLLEIGTNLGISGTYFLEALSQRDDSYFVTMEGLPKLCEISRKQFSSITDPSKFKIIEGLYDSTFPGLVDRGIPFDTIFIDGNHKKEPTLEYFNKLKNNTSNCIVFLFDDINWNKEMTEAWDIIKNDRDVNYSIDLYRMGIAIVDKADPNSNIPFQMYLA